MQISCAYSGLSYKVEHFPLYLKHRESYHPVFDVPTEVLLSHSFKKWEEGELTTTDSYLLYLALFKTTKLVEFRVPCIRTAKTDSIVASNMENLATMVAKIHSIGSEKCTEILNLPRFVISEETCDLTNSQNWIALWNSNYVDYLTGYKTQTALEMISRREYTLERCIKSKLDISKYAASLAEWAALAGNFPFNIAYDNNSNPVRLCDYWKRIIIRVAKDDHAHAVDREDLNCLVEYCEDNIPHGSVFAFTLMTLLRGAQEKTVAYEVFGNIDISLTGDTFRILDADSSIEDANKLALIDTAPTEKPVLEKYPSKLAYLRAKLNYEMAQEYRKGLGDKK